MIGEDECTKLPRWTVASCYGIPTGVLWTVEDPDIQYDPGWEAFEDAASILAELEDEGRRPLPMPWSQEVADRVSGGRLSVRARPRIALCPTSCCATHRCGARLRYRRRATDPARARSPYRTGWYPRHAMSAPTCA